MSWVLGAVPEERLPARNPTYHLVLNGKHCSFVDMALSNPPGCGGTLLPPPGPTQPGPGLHTPGI